MQNKTISRILALSTLAALFPCSNVSAVPPGTASDHSATAASGSIGATVGLAISIGLPKENKSDSPGGAPGNPGGAPGNPGGAPGNPGGAPGNPGGAPGNPGGAPGNPGGGPGGSPGK